MYTLQCAALVLGVSKTTVRRWIDQAGIEKVTIQTDKARMYITHNDVVMLAEKNLRKLGKLDKTTDRDSNSPEQDFYTMEEIATFIGVSLLTVERWLKEHEIEKKFIVTDRRRVYVSYHDVLWLAIQHRYKPKREEVTIGGREDIASLKVATGRDKDLYTIKEISQILGVSSYTIGRWIKKLNISKNYIYTGRERVYIHRRDVLMLVRRHQIRTSPEKRHERGLYTVKDVSLLLGVAEYTICNWLYKLNIRCIRINSDERRMYIHYSDVLVLENWHRERQSRSP
jgi:predicted site-specific integrase-resolvase